MKRINVLLIANVVVLLTNGAMLINNTRMALKLRQSVADFQQTLGNGKFVSNDGSFAVQGNSLPVTGPGPVTADSSPMAIGPPWGKPIPEPTVRPCEQGITLAPGESCSVSIPLHIEEATPKKDKSI